MYFNVSQLMREPSGSLRTHDVEEKLPFAEEGKFICVSGNVKLMRTDIGVWVSARLSSKVLGTCSRCLCSFSQPINMAIEEEFFPAVDVKTGVEVSRLSGADESFYLDRNHILDMEDAIRQYSALSLPMNPLCVNDCEGICLTCGVDLNKIGCTCVGISIDSQVGVLAQLGGTEEKLHGSK